MNYAEYEKLVGQVVRKMTNYSELVNSGSVNVGERNKWQGVSGFKHQIDVSLDNRTDVLLVECKYWNSNNVSVEAFLTLWARVFDVSQGPVGKGRRIRGGLVTKKEFQLGVYTFAKSEYYRKQMSLFVVKSVDDFIVKLHTHFIEVPSISSGERVSIPTIIKKKPED